MHDSPEYRRKEQVTIGEYKRCTDIRVLDFLLSLDKYQDLCVANTIRFTTALTLAKDLIHCEYLLREAIEGKPDQEKPEQEPARRVYIDPTRETATTIGRITDATINDEHNKKILAVAADWVRMTGASIDIEIRVHGDNWKAEFTHSFKAE